MPSSAPSSLSLALAAAFASGGALAQSAGSDAADERTLGAVEVRAGGAAAGNPYGAGRASGPSGATRTDVPLREVPQAVREVPRQLIEDLSAGRLADTLDYVSGVSRQHGLGGLWDNFAVRGFSGNDETGTAYLLNGFVANRGFSAPRDTANTERIEFLKGPSAALYGSGEPGGTINVVTKKPQFTPGYGVELGAGSHDRRRAAADLTGPLGAPGTGLAYRLSLAGEDNGSFRDQVRTRRTLVAPALTWAPGGGTVLNYEGEFVRYRTPFDRGIPAVAGRLGGVPISRFLGEPADGDSTMETQTHQLTADHQLSDDWRLRAGLSHKEGSLTGFSSDTASVRPDGRTVWRQRRYRDYRFHDTGLQAEIAGRFATGGIAHEVLAGVEGYRYAQDQRLLRTNPSAAAPYAIDLYDPVYGGAQPVPRPNTSTDERQRNDAVFLQDQVGLSARWKLMAGVRVDRFHQDLQNLRTATGTQQEHTATSPRLGLTWLANESVSLYASASRSFRPNAGADRNGNAFDPESGRALEAGLKWQSADGRLGGSLAAYRIAKRNVLTTDLADPNFSRAAGEARSRGIEADLAGALDRNWRLSASAAYTDAQVTRDAVLAPGTRLRNVPRVSGSLLLVREDALADGSRYGLGGGLVHVGRRSADAAATLDLPAYTTARLLAYWQATRNARLSLDVDNLFDKTYYASSYSSVWIAPGAPRTVTARLQYRFQ
ncbi:MAG: TonB-dependent siderophore receptor [Xylophilus ampelinus]